MDWLAKVVDLVRLPTRYYAVVAIVTGALLLLPQAVLERLHLDAIPSPYGAIVGLAFLASISLVLVNSVLWLKEWFRVRRNLKKRKETTQRELAQLDPIEKSVLREFYLGQSSVKLPLDHPVVAGLIARGILQAVGRHGRMSRAGMMFPFRLSESAAELVTPTVLGIEEFVVRDIEGHWSISDEGHQWIVQNRPPFL